MGIYDGAGHLLVTCPVRRSVRRGDATAEAQAEAGFTPRASGVASLRRARKAPC